MSNTISQCRAVGLGPLVIALAFSCAACKQSPEILVVFRTEQQAKDHCPDDTIVWVDPQSATYLKDATVDYIEDFRGAGFSVTNPNATGGCGCGKSFNA